MDQRQLPMDAAIIPHHIPQHGFGAMDMTWQKPHRNVAHGKEECLRSPLFFLSRVLNQLHPHALDHDDSQERWTSFLSAGSISLGVTRCPPENLT